VKFILLGTPRSGSHLMRRYIRSHPKLDCITELYTMNIYEDTWEDYFNNEVVDNCGVTLLGDSAYFKNIENYNLIVLLRRNIFEQTLSHSLMVISGSERHYIDGNEDIDNSTYTINVHEFKHLYDIFVKQTQYLIDKTNNSNRVILWYEDIIPYSQTGWTAWMPNKESAKLCKFLNVDWCRLSAKSKKIGQYDKIINYKELYENCNTTE